MKFKSPNKTSDSDIKPPSTVLSKIKSFSWLGGKTKNESVIETSDKPSNPETNTPGSPMPSSLQFIKKLTN